MRRLGDGGARGGWASRSRRTTPGRGSALTPATCWRGSRAPAPTASSLCAHMDTVPLTAPVEPVLVDGGWTNANDGILGADNKSAVAVMVELARRSRGRRAATRGRGRAAVHRLRGDLAARGAGVRRRPAAQPLRLRVRPRHPDRRDRDRGADPAPDRGRVPRAGRARRRAPRSRAERDRRRRPRDRGDAARPGRRGDDRQRRHDRRRDRDQRRPRALPDRGRGAQRRPAARRGARHRDDRPPPGRRRRRRMRPRRRPSSG